MRGKKSAKKKKKKRKLRTYLYIEKGGASSANKLIRILISGNVGCGR